IVVALRDRNYPVQYLLADDEGHGFARPVNNMAMFAASEKFLAKYLGGRFQESMTPEVAKRLAEITVDPKTVTLGSTKPAGGPGSSASSASGKWTLTVDAPGEAVEVVLELQQSGEAITGTMSSTVGGGTVTKGSLSGKKLTASITAEIQGSPMELGLEGTVDGDKIYGTI